MKTDERTQKDTNHFLKQDVSVLTSRFHDHFVREKSGEIH